MQSGDTLEGALAHARAGDESGFLMLWTDLNPRLLRYLRVLGCDDPDDVASEAWLQAVRDLERFRGNAADFRGWLFTVARHRAVDDARSRTRFRDKILGPLTAKAASEQDRPADPSPVEDEVLYGLSTRQAVALVKQLSKDQAEVVALRVIAGLDTDAVAQMLGKSPGAVRVTLHRALKALAKDPRVRALEGVTR
jgi:RNA polymerase sigma-70 factor (ECF subfamily)